jgi:hypothetical protein
MSSKTPDSGTAKRLMALTLASGGAGTAGYGLGGGEGATETGLGTALLLAAGGSRPAQRALVAALTERPDRMVRIGNYLVNRSGVGGWTGAGTLAPLLIGN